MLYTQQNTLIDEEIEVVSDFKFLGIILNKHMKWTSHTESIANTISKYTGVINGLKHTLTHTAYFIQYINTTRLILRFTILGT